MANTQDDLSARVGEDSALNTIDGARAFLTSLAAKAKTLTEQMNEPLPELPKVPKAPSADDVESFVKSMDALDAAISEASKTMEKSLCTLGEAGKLLSEYRRTIRRYPELRDEFKDVFE